MLDFRMFEQTLKVIQTDEVVWEDGYEVPTKSYEKPFKGVLVDKMADKAEIQGVRERIKGSEARGGSARLLYVRLSQEWYPNLVTGDIVIDSRNDKWKVIERYDYETEGNCIVWVVARVNP